MIIDLPKSFRLVSNTTGYAEVIDGVLHLYGNISFNKVMYHVTFALKGNKTCYYCGSTISPKKVTLDHIYARFIGGPTIPNNLVPCCPKCNQKKSNLSAEQFKFYLSLPEKDAKAYRRLILSHQNSLKDTGESKLPKEWLTTANPDHFIIRIFLDQCNTSKKYNRLAEDYNRYHTIFNPVIIDKNNFVLSGSTILLFAKNNGLKEIPVIVLENVVVHL